MRRTVTITASGDPRLSSYDALRGHRQRGRAGLVAGGGDRAGRGRALRANGGRTSRTSANGTGRSGSGHGRGSRPPSRRRQGGPESPTDPQTKPLHVTRCRTEGTRSAPPGSGSAHSPYPPPTSRSAWVSQPSSLSIRSPWRAPFSSAQQPPSVASRGCAQQWQDGWPQSLSHAHPTRTIPSP